MAVGARKSEIYKADWQARYSVLKRLILFKFCRTAGRKIRQGFYGAVMS